MGEVVLDGDELRERGEGCELSLAHVGSCRLQGRARTGGEIIRVRVGGDDGRCGVVEPLEVGDDAAEGLEGLVGFQVADVLADEDLRPHGEGDGVLQMGADGEDVGDCSRCSRSGSRIGSGA